MQVEVLLHDSLTASKVWTTKFLWIDSTTHRHCRSTCLIVKFIHVELSCATARSFRSSCNDERRHAAWTTWLSVQSSWSVMYCLVWQITNLFHFYISQSHCCVFRQQEGEIRYSRSSLLSCGSEGVYCSHGWLWFEWPNDETILIR